ncbi:hypothetical protein M0534_02355 [Methylonatrum kenyense]|uniref:hypothetical protein n=1 Tax=Methylonatrum kenyense TaxID=455253 RepID=UPI0020C1610C|nr:hypothetical protein [Methylonatrum kenyense]MCK8515177.1 hypothetical protein [Methylonatrum kenyense]
MAKTDNIRRAWQKKRMLHRGTALRIKAAVEFSKPVPMRRFRQRSCCSGHHIEKIAFYKGFWNKRV